MKLLKNFIKILLVILLCLIVITKFLKPDTSEPSISDSKIRYADMIPDPKAAFPNGTISITDEDGGTAYFFQVTNYNDGEYESYVEGCKKLGFDDVAYEYSHEKGRTFGAYSTDGAYWADVDLDSEKDIIYIGCRKSRGKTEEGGGAAPPPAN